MGPDIHTALRIFSEAWNYTQHGHRAIELQWHRQSSFNSFTEPELLREAAWVILCSGFREATVRQRFNQISLCFCDWESAAEILGSYPACKVTAYSVFGNNAKLDAILNVARRVQAQGFKSLKDAILKNPIRQLQQLPFIGATTVWHLAKNLGLNVAKPDRHLLRISRTLGFSDPRALCHALSELTGQQDKVVDLVIWRYLADHPRLRSQWL